MKTNCHKENIGWSYPVTNDFFVYAHHQLLDLNVVVSSYQNGYRYLALVQHAVILRINTNSSINTCIDTPLNVVQFTFLVILCQSLQGNAMFAPLSPPTPPPTPTQTHLNVPSTATDFLKIYKCLRVSTKVNVQRAWKFSIEKGKGLQWAISPKWLCFHCCQSEMKPIHICNYCQVL